MDVQRPMPRMRLEERLDDRTEALATQVIGAAIEVHRALGPGLLEVHYEEAMCVELTDRQVPFVRQRAVSIDYKGRTIGEGRVDLLVDDLLVLELKAVQTIIPLFEAVVLAYLRMTKKRLGLIINFHVPVLKEGIKRLVL